MLKSLVDYISPTLTGAGFASLLLALVGIYASSPDHWTSVSLIWSYSIGSMLLGGVAGLLHYQALIRSELRNAEAAINTLKMEQNRLLAAGGLKMPRILRSNFDMPGRSCPMLLVQPSPLFGVGLAASIYLKTIDGFDVLLGEGRVETIQEDSKIIQVEVTDVREGYSREWQDIRNNSNATLHETSVRLGNQAR